MHKSMESLKLNKKLHGLLPILAVVSVVVVIGVFWWLKIVGITMTAEACCGYEEHVHTEECAQKTLICTLEEASGHTHEEACRVTELVCEKEQTEGHTHEEACFAKHLACELSETDEHSHEEACYAESLTCLLQEEAAHAHTEECYIQTLVCTLNEEQGHTHDDACYRIDCTLGKQEHIHTPLCYSDENADVETASVWEASLADASLTGVAGEDLAAIAQTQLGYTESVQNFVLNDDGTRRGYTRYGAWYGNPHGDWSAMFVAFCMNYADIGSDAAPYNTGTNAMMLAWQERGLFEATDDLPQTGDIVFIDARGSGSCTDVGVVAEADGVITVIQGNVNDRVEKVTYDADDSCILGYGSIRKIVENSLSERDRARVGNAIAQIDALPTQEEVLRRMEGYDQSSEAYALWHDELALRVMTAYAYYEDLGPNLQTLINGASKLDSLQWLWKSAPTRASVVTSVNVYQANSYANALTTVCYGGSVYDVMTSYLDYAYWDAIIIDKNEIGFYISGVYVEAVSKLDLAPSTEEGFIVLVWHGSSDRINITNVAVGQCVNVNPAEFYKNTKTSTSPIGTVTFTTDAVNGEDNTDINQEKLSVIQGVDTNKLIKINLYNYGSNINDLYSSNSKYPGFQQDGGTESVSSLSRFGMNFGNNITVDLETQIGNVTTNNPSAINATVNGANSSLSGAMLTTLKDGYPALSDGTSLAYLFSDSEYATKKNTNNLNGLFLYNNVTGEYTFNSRENHAQFDSATDTFILYDQLISSNFLMYPFGNFLPFNDIVSQTTQTTTIDRAWFQKIAANALFKYNSGSGSEYLTLYNSMTAYISLMDQKYGAGNWDYNEAINVYFELNGIEFTQTESYLDTVYSIDYDEATDFFFGMDMHLEFMQTKDGLTGLDGQQPIVFEFIGDDDVWIYIDGTLFLDLSGIHRHVGGKIDFTNGKVYYYDLDVSTGQVSEEPTRVVTFAEILGSSDTLNDKGTFIGYTSHTLNFYYMERGAGSGVCQMNFNIPMVTENHIAVTKELDIDPPDMLGDPDFLFQIYKEGGEELLIGEGVEYAVYDQNGLQIATRLTGSNGIFTIKDGETAIFDVSVRAGKYFVRELFDPAVYEQYGTVVVDGTSVTTDTFTDVIVNEDTFKGVDSNVKEIAYGSTSFLFENHIDVYQYGKLEISKEFRGDSTASAEKEVTFLVKIDGEPIAAGTEYELTAADGTQSTETIAEEGSLTFVAGQRVLLQNILAGAVVEICESEQSAFGYNVSYSGENIELTESERSVSGMIGANTKSTVTVINEKEGTKLLLPVQKTLLYPDGEEHKYSFVLQQIVSLQEHSAAEGGKHQTAGVVLDSGSAETAFTLYYPLDSTAEGTYYYMIFEEGAFAGNGMDTEFYIVEVLVSITDGGVNASVGSILKNGTEHTQEVSFVNQNVRSLTVTKTVERLDGCTTPFRFDITAQIDGVPLSGTFPCEASNGQSEISFSDGTATVYLKDGEQITINALPYGTQWIVTEQKTNSFFTECGSQNTQRASGNSVEGTLTEDESAYFINIGGYEMPSTGSYANLLCIFGGSLLMLLALICGCILRCKRERRACK